MASPWKPSPGLVEPLESAVGCGPGGAWTGKPFSSGSANPGVWDCSGSASKAAKGAGLSRNNSPFPDTAVWKRSQTRLPSPPLPGELEKGGGSERGRERQSRSFPSFSLGEGSALSHPIRSTAPGMLEASQGKPHPVSSRPHAHSPDPTFPAHAQGSAAFQTRFKFSRVPQAFG